ncbi:MAG: TRAP transporter substrate-binding protein [Alcanivorax sp.]|nr:TRAP transporter substrate-binding protein [Alcanivorax sp.]
MDRRKFVAALGLGSAATLAGCGPQEECVPGLAEGEQTYRWRMVTSWPKNYPGVGTGPERFAELVEKMSGGQMRIRVYGAGELVPAFETFDAVSQGNAEMGHGASYYWRGKHPATPFFTAVPFGLNAQEMNAWISRGGGQQLWDSLYEGFNLKPFRAGCTGTQMAGWYNKEINSLADLRGLRIRIPGLGGEVMRRVGANPVQLPGGEVYTAMQTGAIDAAEWVGPYNDITFGFQRIARYYYYPGWQEPGPLLELLINLHKWNALPPRLQTIIETAALAVNQEVYDEYTERNAAALEELTTRHKVQLRRLPDDVIIALKKASDEVLAELVAGNAQAEEVYASYRAFEKRAVPYHAIAEEAYYQIRTLTLSE